MAIAFPLPGECLDNNLAERLLTILINGSGVEAIEHSVSLNKFNADVRFCASVSDVPTVSALSRQRTLDIVENKSQYWSSVRPYS